MKVKTACFVALALMGLLLQWSPAAAFTGTGTGNIPDCPSDPTNGPAQYTGSPLVVSFNVSGLTTNIQTMSLSITMWHQWVGDLNVYLTSPGGTNFTLFSRVGPPGPLGFGNSADLNGTYVFADNGTNTLRNATDALNLDLFTGDDYTNVIPAGIFLPSAVGPTNEPATKFTANSHFMGLTPAQASGTWTLTFYDGGSGDTGAVTSATMYINEPVSLPPRITSLVAGAGTAQFKLTGPATNNFTLWRGTNLAQPFSTWTRQGSGTFDLSGSATLNVAMPASPRFFRMSSP
jgi:subtilisin-like proprotein convertase family protein